MISKNEKRIICHSQLEYGFHKKNYRYQESFSFFDIEESYFLWRKLLLLKIIRRVEDIDFIPPKFFQAFFKKFRKSLYYIDQKNAPAKIFPFNKEANINFRQFANWKDLINQRFLEKLEIDCKPIDDSDDEDYDSEANSKSHIIQDIESFLERKLPMMYRLSQLRVLGQFDSDLFEGLKIMNNSLSKFPNLKEIILKIEKDPDSKLSSEELEVNSKITHLEASIGINLNFLEWFSQMIHSFCKIQTLKLTLKDISDPTFQYFQGLNQINTVRYMKLCTYRFSQKCWTSFIKNMEYPPFVKILSLEIHDNSIDKKEDLRMFAEKLKMLKELDKLELFWKWEYKKSPEIRYQDAIYEILENLGSLTSLKLGIKFGPTTHSQGKIFESRALSFKKLMDQFKHKQNLEELVLKVPGIVFGKDQTLILNFPVLRNLHLEGVLHFSKNIVYNFTANNFERVKIKTIYIWSERELRESFILIQQLKCEKNIYIGVNAEKIDGKDVVTTLVSSLQKNLKTENNIHLVLGTSYLGDDQAKKISEIFEEQKSIASLEIKTIEKGHYLLQRGCKLKIISNDKEPYEPYY